MSVVLVLILHDKAGNYRQIAITTVFRKIIILDRIELLLSTNSDQFDLKRTRDPNQFIYVSKEIIDGILLAVY